VLSVISSETGASGGLFDFANSLSAKYFQNMGFYIIGIFLASWLISMLVYKIRRIDLLDASLAVSRAEQPH